MVFSISLLALVGARVLAGGHCPGIFLDSVKEGAA